MEMNLSQGPNWYHLFFGSDVVLLLDGLAFLLAIVGCVAGGFSVRRTWPIARQWRYVAALGLGLDAIYAGVLLLVAIQFGVEAIIAERAGQEFRVLTRLAAVYAGFGGGFAIAACGWWRVLARVRLPEHLSLFHAP